MECLTHFDFLGRKMMDAEARKKGYDNYTCADDISLLLKLIYQEKLINKEASQLMLDIFSCFCIHHFSS